MKIKNIIIFLLIIFSVFIIYLKTNDKKIYYLDLDINNYKHSKIIKKYLNDKNKLEKYVSGYIEKDYRTTDLINDINYNKTIKIKNKKQTIQNSLIKADLVTITTGINDINYYNDNLYEKADEMLNDIEKLIKILRKYCKEKIVLIKIKNIYGKKYQELFDYINEHLEEICSEYDVIYINGLLNENEIKKILNIE